MRKNDEAYNRILDCDEDFEDPSIYIPGKLFDLRFHQNISLLSKFDSISQQAMVSPFLFFGTTSTESV